MNSQQPALQTHQGRPANASKDAAAAAASPQGQQQQQGQHSGASGGSDSQNAGPSSGGRPRGLRVIIPRTARAVATNAVGGRSQPNSATSVSLFLLACHLYLLVSYPLCTEAMTFHKDCFSFVGGQ